MLNDWSWRIGWLDGGRRGDGTETRVLMAQVDELKQRLTARGLSTTGCKDNLARRLKNAQSRAAIGAADPGDAEAARKVRIVCHGWVCVRVNRTMTGAACGRGSGRSPVRRRELREASGLGMRKTCRMMIFCSFFSYCCFCCDDDHDGDDDDAFCLCCDPSNSSKKRSCRNRHPYHRSHPCHVVD